MKILFLCPVLPHALAVSGVINVNRRIRLLIQRGHQVGLAAFLDPSDASYVPEMRAGLHQIELLPHPSGRLSARRAARYALGTLPVPFWQACDPAMRKLVGHMINREHYDVVVAEFSVMGQYLYCNPYLPPVRRVISCHSCLTSAQLNAVALAPWGVDRYRKRMALRGLADYEFGMYRSADLVLSLTTEEKYDLLKHAPELRISVVPYGVDVEHFRPSPLRPEEECLVYTGYYRQEPNRDAVIWFAESVWPMLRQRWPNLKFYVVGRDPTRRMMELMARDDRIVVTGEVADVAPYLARARLYVCPMRMGTGFRGKVLQAMAAGVPVVATSMAAEGIPAQTGENMMLADTPRMMFESINLLLSDPEMRRSMAAAARDLVVNRFSWERCVDLLERELTALVE